MNGPPFAAPDRTLTDGVITLRHWREADIPAVTRICQDPEIARCGSGWFRRTWSSLRAVNGVGIDLLEIDRLERALQRRPRLEERFFTEVERAYANSRPRPIQHLAARFCAKEAVAKALELDAWRWRDVEVGPRGAVVLHGGVADSARRRGGEVRVSLTHTRTTAGAIAVIG